MTNQHAGVPIRARACDVSAAGRTSTALDRRRAARRPRAGPRSRARTAGHCSRVLDAPRGSPSLGWVTFELPASAAGAAAAARGWAARPSGAPPGASACAWACASEAAWASPNSSRRLVPGAPRPRAPRSHRRLRALAPRCQTVRPRLPPARRRRVLTALVIVLVRLVLVLLGRLRLLLLGLLLVLFAGRLRIVLLGLLLVFLIGGLRLVSLGLRRGLHRRRLARHSVVGQRGP